jgi:hypothetical protein
MVFDSRRWVFAIVGVTLLAGVIDESSARCVRGAEYTQSDAVRQRYPDPAQRFDTPGFAVGKAGYTTHAEMMAYLEALGDRSDRMLMRIAGHSQERRVLPALFFSDSGRFGPTQLRRLSRPVVLLLGQLHGNEPAGGEAMLAVARELAEGELASLLDRITVVIVPRLNPDGAHYFWRGTASCVDINRDHLKLDLPETMALRRLTTALPPDVVVDAHEFSVATRWLQKFGAIQSYDVMTAHATHPNIHRGLTETAERVFGRGIARDVARAGYSHFWYYTTAYNPKDKRVVGGGTVPDIGRNYAGLANALSLLVETRGVGIGRDSYARRVHTQYVALASILRSTAEHAGAIREATSAARADTVRLGAAPNPADRVAVTLKTPARRETLEMLDPDSAETRAIEVDWVDPREAVPALTRQRPYAYLVLPSQTEVTRRFMMAGLTLRRLTKPTELEVERFEVTERRQGAVFVEGHLRSTVTTEVLKGKRLFPAGTYVYSMAQPAANLLVAALEPESSSSFVALGVVPADKRGVANPQEAAPSELPIYRVVSAVPLETEPSMAPSPAQR